MSSLAMNLRILTAAIVGLGAAGVATGAQAQTTQCGITGSTSAAPVVYDPFNPTGLQTTTVTLTMTRVNGGGGGDTRVVNFYLKANSATGTAADGTSIIPRSYSGSASVDGLAYNIFYNYNNPGPTITPITLLPSSGNKFMKVDFTGNNAGSDSILVTFDITLPASLDLAASPNLAFDVEYFCDIQGGRNNGSTYRGTMTNAVVFPVTVLSALKASYVGTALDFGEIGQVPATPPSPVRTNVLNHVLVFSSGAYRVRLTSQNGYKLKRTGAATINDEVRYSLKFLGDTRSPGNVTTIDHTCMRAGITAAGESLPIQATLIDGGAGKTPSPTYSDALTVTLEPLIYSNTGVDDCGSYTVP